VPCFRGRFIPARAGNSHGKSLSFCIIAVHPRPCGEQTLPIYAVHDADGSSPPVRGTAKRFRPTPGNSRFIPARAGNSC